MLPSSTYSTVQCIIQTLLADKLFCRLGDEQFNWRRDDVLPRLLPHLSFIHCLFVRFYSPPSSAFPSFFFTVSYSIRLSSVILSFRLPIFYVLIPMGILHSSDMFICSSLNIKSNRACSWQHLSDLAILESKFGLMACARPHGVFYLYHSMPNKCSSVHIFFYHFRKMFRAFSRVLQVDTIFIWGCRMSTVQDCYCHGLCRNWLQNLGFSFTCDSNLLTVLRGDSTHDTPIKLLLIYCVAVGPNWTII